MSVRLRLKRVGSKKNPIWRVVVTDQRSPRDGRFIESVGHYNPQTNPSTIVLDDARLEHWLARGAQPTNTVKKLMNASAKGAPAASSEPAPAAAEEPGAPAATEVEEPAEAPTAAVAEDTAPAEGGAAAEGPPPEEGAAAEESAG
jgi:small subunit ribosomal protein S16